MSSLSSATYNTPLLQNPCWKNQYQHANAEIILALTNDLIYECLSFCDLRSLWMYGRTCKRASRLTFSAQTTCTQLPKPCEKILDLYQSSFESELRDQIRSFPRIRLSRTFPSQAVNFWRTRSGEIVSQCTASNSAAKVLTIYPSFQSFYKQKEGNSLSQNINPRQMDHHPWCHPVFYEDTIIYLSGPTVLHKVTLKPEFHEIIYKVTNVKSLWSIALIPTSFDDKKMKIPPSVLLTTSDGFLHFPHIFSSSKRTFESNLVYTSRWACQAMPPAIAAWTEGSGVLIATRPAGLTCKGIYLLQLCDQTINEVGVVPCAGRVKIAINSEGILGLTYPSASERRLTVQVWKISLSIQKSQKCLDCKLEQLSNYTTTSSWGYDSLIVFFDYVGNNNTLVAITTGGRLFGWNVSRSDNVNFLGSSMLIRRQDDGPIKRAVLWPNRGSFFLISTASIHEWVVGTPHLRY